MKAHLGCQSVRSMCWVVKKEPTQTMMIYDKRGGTCANIEIPFFSRGAKEENFDGLS